MTLSRLNTIEMIYIITSLIATIGSIILGFFVYFKNRSSKINKTYLLMSLNVALWSCGLFFCHLYSSKEISLYWNRFLHAAAAFIPVTYFHFILELLQKRERKRRILFLGYVAALVLAISSATPLLIKNMEPKLWFKVWPIPGSAYPLFMLLFSIFSVYSFYLAFKEFRSAKGFYREQLKYIILGMIVGFGGGATNYPLIFNIRVLPVGHFFIFFYVILYAYTIVKHHLMDIPLTITRTGIFLTLYTLILGTPFILERNIGNTWLLELLGMNSWIAPLALMAALATAGPFLYIFLQKRAEAILLREQRRYQEILKQASIGMTRIRELDKLLNLVAHIVTKTVRISHSAIYLFDSGSGQFLLETSRNVKQDQPTTISNKSLLIVWLQNKRKALIHEELKRIAQDNHTSVFKELEKDMSKLNASVLVPSFLEDRLLGFLILGDKRSGAIYTKEDMDVFSVLANQAALAIENAQFIQQAQMMQEQIAQAEKMATIGTMADGLSHQINNRLHALAMISGDTLDTINLTDTSGYPQEAQKVIEEAKYSMERIQANVLQGREVVNGLLKYSRKGETGHAVIVLDEIIDGALEMVKFKVKLSEIDILRDYPHTLPKIKGNLTQLEEVMFNLIDNANDAIKERKDTLKEEDYRGKITISSRLSKDSFLTIAFEDNDMGVKEEDRRKLFTPFFTTKVSSRKGTGLGLFVINRIITEMHKGKIEIESEHGKGTTFILKLPLAKSRG